MPSSEPRNATLSLRDMIRDRKESTLSTGISELLRSGGAARKPGVRLAAARTRGTFRNRSGNEAESQRERRSRLWARAGWRGRCEGAFARIAPLLTKRLRRRAHGRGQGAQTSGASALLAAASSHADSTIATEQAGAAGNLALRSGEAV